MKTFFTKFCIVLSTVVIIALTAVAIAGIHMVKFFRRFKFHDRESDENQSGTVPGNTYAVSEILKIKEGV